MTLDGQRRLAEGHHKIDQNTQSEKVYSILLSEPEGIVPEDFYNYAMVLKTNGKYVEGSKWMDKFIELKPNDLRAMDYVANKDELTAFTRNHYLDKSKDRVVELQIYFSDFKLGKWTKPEPFFLNKKEYSVGQPCLTSNGNTMYFTSDMPGGYGKADIYRISKDENGV